MRALYASKRDPFRDASYFPPSLLGLASNSSPNIDTGLFSLTTATTKKEAIIEMSSPAHRRQRSSGTPKRSSQRSSQAPPSSPPDPSAAQLLGEAASSSQASRGHGTPRRQPKSSSPMNFRSSPVAGRQDAASPFSRGTPDIAMTDGDRTPRPSGHLMRGE